METGEKGNSKTNYSSVTNEQILGVASRMYLLNEGDRSLLTDELERRSLGPDEIQAYIEAQAEKTRAPEPKEGLFGWIWPTIKDERTASNASSRAILFSAFGVLLGILGCVSSLFVGLSAGSLTDRNAILGLVFFSVAGLVWAFVHRGVVNQSPVWAGVGLAMSAGWVVHSWMRGDWKYPIAVCLDTVVVLAFINGIRGTAAYRRYARGSGGRAHA